MPSPSQHAFFSQDEASVLLERDELRALMSYQRDPARYRRRAGAWELVDQEAQEIRSARSALARRLAASGCLASALAIFAVRTHPGLGLLGGLAFAAALFLPLLVRSRQLYEEQAGPLLARPGSEL